MLTSLIGSTLRGLRRSMSATEIITCRDSSIGMPDVDWLSFGAYYTIV